MLPAGIAATVSPHSRSHTASGPRTGRLRGFFHYSHAHSHQNSSPASTTVTTTTVTNTQNNTTATLPQQQQQQQQTTTRTRQRRATSPLNNTNSWIPTVSGVSGLSRVATLPAAELSRNSVHATNVVSSSPSPAIPSSSDDLNIPVRSIDETISTDSPSSSQQLQPSQQQTQTQTQQPAMSRIPSTPAVAQQPPQPQPSIRFTPYTDQRSGRQSLYFAPIERSLRHKDDRIKVGRASERGTSDPYAPVGFSSKVVSRRHCEFWCDNGQWFIKDIKSSSGTFLNHIRLSAPGIESKAYPLKDGDILQLGIDFKGGEEQIFRCVKIRIELNRAWQKALNHFNMSAHRRLRNLAKGEKDSDACSIHSSECAICLLSVAPCQSLFVAPCSHVWHYKCIRPLVEKDYPTFLCPNCRAIADLEREIDEDEFGDGWEIPTAEAMVQPPPPPPPPQQHEYYSPPLPPAAVVAGEPSTATAAVPPPPLPSGTADPPAHLDPLSEPTRPPPLPPTTPPPQTNNPWRGCLDEAGEDAEDEGEEDEDEEDGSSGGETGHDGGPLTPMNDAGPYVLDGRDRVDRRRTLFMPLSALQPGETYF
ncbi:SMAD/FHA domain-containing protein [Wilcoxina mikolae CBS 423.85]|nr:SMAD/FHA domain-containing protein [Wilcoxina mikolae CBS 423.85]